MHLRAWGIIFTLKFFYRVAFLPLLLNIYLKHKYKQGSLVIVFISHILKANDFFQVNFQMITEDFIT